MATLPTLISSYILASTLHNDYLTRTSIYAYWLLENSSIDFQKSSAFGLYSTIHLKARTIKQHASCCRFISHIS